MTFARIALALLGVALCIQIGFAAAQADIFASFAEVGADPWGLVGLLDLYLGFAIVAVLLIWLEPVPAIRWPLIVLLFVLGNPLLAFWAAWRLPLLAARLQRGDRTPSR